MYVSTPYGPLYARRVTCVSWAGSIVSDASVRSTARARTPCSRRLAVFRVFELFRVIELFRVFGTATDYIIYKIRSAYVSRKGDGAACMCSLSPPTFVAVIAPSEGSGERLRLSSSKLHRQIPTLCRQNTELAKLVAQPLPPNR